MTPFLILAPVATFLLVFVIFFALFSKRKRINTQHAAARRAKRSV
jgi:hypothetical protein